jgi:excisionase family DNA binding protein
VKDAINSIPASLAKARKNRKATLTPHQVAAECGFGINATYTMLRNGQLPSIRVQNRFFVPRAALEKWLETCGQAR